MSQIEIVRALKWAAPDHDSFRDVIESFHKELVIYDNTDQVSLSHSLGAQGFVGHLGTCWPEYPLRTWELLEKKDYSSVKDHLDSFKVGWRRWIEKVGVLTAGEGPLVKTPMEIAGLKVGPPRPPGIRPPNHLISYWCCFQLVVVHQELPKQHKNKRLCLVSCKVLKF